MKEVETERKDYDRSLSELTAGAISMDTHAIPVLISRANISDETVRKLQFPKPSDLLIFKDR